MGPEPRTHKRHFSWLHPPSSGGWAQHLIGMNNSSPVSFALKQQLLASSADEFACHGWAWAGADGIPQSRVPADSATHTRRKPCFSEEGGDGDEQEPQLLKMDAENLLPYVARALFCSGGKGVFSLLAHPWQHLTEFVNH